MPGQLGSATINTVNNVRHTMPCQEPIGADTADTHPTVLANGTIGGGFNAVDDAVRGASPVRGLFPVQNPGVSNEGAGMVDSQYVVANVPVTAGQVVTVDGGAITVAGAGTYTSPQALATGKYGWVFLT